jgi:nucleolar protein 58
MRLRQLEGGVMAADGARVRGQANIPQYNPGRQGTNPALITEAKGYNPDADVTADAAPSEEKKKKKKVGH